VIYRTVDWITRLESFALPDARHPLLGGPTMCVTTIHGGLNINSVPDSVTFTIDFRSIPSNSHEDCRKAIRTTLGGKAEITTVADLPRLLDRGGRSRPCARGCRLRTTIRTRAGTARRALLHRRVGADAGIGRGTDRSHRTSEMGQAHQTDEYCTVRRIEEASEIYRDLIRSLCL
jgi:succinyl-diaminopimelate desuccinylase